MSRPEGGTRETRPARRGHTFIALAALAALFSWAGAAAAQCTGGAAGSSCLPGNGGEKTDCHLEWRTSATADLRRNGLPKNRIVCYEGDPRCDLDPDLDNQSCSVAVALCINNHDARLDACSPSAVDTFEVKKPRPDRPRDGVDATNAAALEQAAEELGLTVIRRDGTFSSGSPNSTPDLCTSDFGVTVPLRRQRSGALLRGRETVRVGATTVLGEHDADALRVECRPSTCGDGVIDSNEECDDGNRDPGDGCDPGCHIEPPTPTPTPTETTSSTATQTPTNTSPVPQADLSVSQTDSPDPVMVSTDVTYVIRVHNGGPLDATAAVLTDNPPAGGVVVSADTDAGSCTAAVGAVTCSLGTIAAGSTADVSVVVTAPAVAGSVSNTASAVSAIPDPNLQDNSSMEQTEVLETVPPTPTLTPTPIAPIGTVVVQLNGSSKAVLQAKNTNLNLSMSGSFKMEIGAPDAAGLASIVIPKDDFHLDPVSIGIIGYACVTLVEDGTGSIDCDGGDPELDFDIAQDHVTNPGNTNNSGSAAGLPDDPECDDSISYPNGEVSTACVEGSPCDTQESPKHPGICNSPRSFALSGVKGAGDAISVADIRITVVENGQEGPDGQPCTADDTPGVTTESPVVLTTGTASVSIFDADRVNSRRISPDDSCGGFTCTAAATGSAFSCEALRGGVVTGAAIVGGFPSLDINPFGDGAITFTLAGQ